MSSVGVPCAHNATHKKYCKLITVDFYFFLSQHLCKIGTHCHTIHLLFNKFTISTYKKYRALLQFYYHHWLYTEIIMDIVI